MKKSDMSIWRVSARWYWFMNAARTLWLICLLVGVSCASVDRVERDTGEAESTVVYVPSRSGAEELVAPWGKLRQALDAYKSDVGRFPSADEGLSALVTMPSSLTPVERVQWKGPYVEEQALVDPWGHPFLYRFPPTFNVGDAPVVTRLSDDSISWPPGTRFAVSADRTRLALFPDQVDLWSAGSDGASGTDDDVANWLLYINGAGQPTK